MLHEFAQYNPKESCMRVADSVFGDFSLSFGSNYGFQGFDLPDAGTLLAHTSCPPASLGMPNYESTPSVVPSVAATSDVGLTSQQACTSGRIGFSGLLPLASCPFPEQLAETFQAPMVTCSDSSQSRDFLYGDALLECGAESYDSRLSAPLQDSDAVLAELFFASCGGSTSSTIDEPLLDNSTSSDGLDNSGLSEEDSVCRGPTGDSASTEVPSVNVGSPGQRAADAKPVTVPSMSLAQLIKQEHVPQPATLFLMPFAPPALLAQAFNFAPDAMPALKLPQTAIADIQAKALGMKNFVPEHYGQTLTSSIIEHLQKLQPPHIATYSIVPTCTPSDTESFEEDKDDSADTVLEVPTMEGHDAARLSIEVPMTRQQRIDRYRKKKQRRLFALNMVRYQLRKVCAENRPRIKGRFVTKVQLQQAVDVVME